MRFIVYLSSCRGIITRATQSRVCNTRGETAGSDQSEPELEGDSKPHNTAVNETKLMLFLRLYKYKTNVNENMLHGHEGTWKYALLYMLFFLLPPPSPDGSVLPEGHALLHQDGGVREARRAVLQEKRETFDV